MDFKDFFFIFVNMGSYYEYENFQKRYSSHSYGSFSTKLFLNVPCNNPYKSYQLGVKNLELKFIIVAKGKMKKIVTLLEMTNRRAKRSEIWDSAVLTEHIWDTFDF